MEAAIKKIPYGMTDFESIIRDGYYYVDKTQYRESRKYKPFLFLCPSPSFREESFPEHAGSLLRHQQERQVRGKLRRIIYRQTSHAQP